MMPTSVGAPTLAVHFIADSSKYIREIYKIQGITHKVAKSTAMGIGVISAALLGVGTAAAKVGQDFQFQLKLTATVANATGIELKKLEQRAREIGRTTSFSAAEAAAGMYGFASAGYKTEQMLEAIGHTMELAGAFAYDLYSTTDMVVAALRQFGMQTSETQRIVDAYTQGVIESLLTMERLRYSMSYAGPVAAGFRMTIEETVLALEQFSNIGLEGSRIGVAFRMMMKEAAKATQEKVQALKKYNLTMEDVNPATKKFIGLIKAVADNAISVSDSLKIFGARTGGYVVAIANMYRAGILKWNEDLKEFENAAGRTHKIFVQMMGTFKMEALKLRNVVQDVLISIFQKMEGPIIEMFKNLSQSFNFLSQDIQKGGGWLTYATEGLTSFISQLGILIKYLKWAAGAFLTFAVPITSAWAALKLFSNQNIKLFVGGIIPFLINSFRSLLLVLPGVNKALWTTANAIDNINAFTFQRQGAAGKAAWWSSNFLIGKKNIPNFAPMLGQITIIGAVIGSIVLMIKEWRDTQKQLDKQWAEGTKEVYQRLRMTTKEYRTSVESTGKTIDDIYKSRYSGVEGLITQQERLNLATHEELLLQMQRLDVHKQMLGNMDLMQKEYDESAKNLKKIFDTLYKDQPQNAQEAMEKTLNIWKKWETAKPGGWAAKLGISSSEYPVFPQEVQQRMTNLGAASQSKKLWVEVNKVYNDMVKNMERMTILGKRLVSIEQELTKNATSRKQLLQSIEGYLTDMAMKVQSMQTDELNDLMEMLGTISEKGGDKGGAAWAELINLQIQTYLKSVGLAKDALDEMSKALEEGKMLEFTNLLKESLKLKTPQEFREIIDKTVAMIMQMYNGSIDQALVDAQGNEIMKQMLETEEEKARREFRKSLQTWSGKKLVGKYGGYSTEKLEEEFMIKWRAEKRKEALKDMEEMVYKSTHNELQIRLHAVDEEVEKWKKGYISEAEALKAANTIKERETKDYYDELEKTMEAAYQDIRKETFEGTLSEYEAELAEADVKRLERMTKLNEELAKYEVEGANGAVQIYKNKQRDIENIDKAWESDRRKALKSRWESEVEVQQRIMELRRKGVESEILSLVKEVAAYEDAGVNKILIEQYTQERLMEIYRESNSRYLEYYRSMVEDMKSTLSDVFVQYLDDPGNEKAFEELGQKLADNITKSFADIQVERISGWINQMLETDFAKKWVDTLGLGPFAEAFKETRTPPSLKVLDEQYTIQKQQWSTQRDILKTLQGKSLTSLPSSLQGPISQLPPKVQSVLEGIVKTGIVAEKQNNEIISKINNAVQLLPSKYDPEGIKYDEETALKLIAQGILKDQGRKGPRPGFVPSGDLAGLVLEGKGTPGFQKLQQDVAGTGEIVKQYGRYWVQYNHITKEASIVTENLAEETKKTATNLKSLNTNARILEQGVLDLNDKATMINPTLENLKSKLKGFLNALPGTNVLETLYDNLGLDTFFNWIKQGFSSIFNTTGFSAAKEAFKNIPEYLGLDKLAKVFKTVKDWLPLDTIEKGFKKVFEFTGLSKEWGNLKQLFSQLTGGLFKEKEAKSPLEAINVSNEILTDSLLVQKEMLRTLGGQDPTGASGYTDNAMKVIGGVKSLFTKSSKDLTSGKQVELGNSLQYASASANEFSNSVLNASSSTWDFSSMLSSILSGGSGGSGGGEGGGLGSFTGFSKAIGQFRQGIDVFQQFTGMGGVSTGMGVLPANVAAQEAAAGALQVNTPMIVNSAGAVTDASLAATQSAAAASDAALAASSSLASLSAAGTGSGVGSFVGGMTASGLSKTRGKATGAAVGGAVGGVTGAAVTMMMTGNPYAIIAGAILAALSSAMPTLFGADPVKRQRQAKGRMFGQGIDTMIEGEYSSLGQMVEEMPSYMLSPKYLYYSQNYLGKNVPKSEIAFGAQQKMGMVKTVMEDMGELSPALSGAMNLLNMQLEAFVMTVKRDFPESAKKTDELRQKMLGLFKEDTLKLLKTGVTSLGNVRHQLKNLGLEDAETMSQEYEASLTNLFNETMPLGQVQLEYLYEGLKELKDDMQEAEDRTEGLTIATELLASGFEMTGKQLEMFRDNAENLEKLRFINLYKALGIEELTLTEDSISNFDDMIEELQISLQGFESNITQFVSFSESLPDSMKKAKKGLMEFAYGIDYLRRTTKELVDIIGNVDDFADAWEMLKKGIAASDFGAINDAIGSLALQLTDVIELMIMFGDIANYAGLKGIANLTTSLLQGPIKVLYVLITAIQLTISWLKLLKGWADSTAESFWKFIDQQLEAGKISPNWGTWKDFIYNLKLSWIGFIQFIMNSIGQMFKWDLFPDDWGDVWAANAIANLNDIFGKTEETTISINDMYWSLNQLSETDFVNLTGQINNFMTALGEGISPEIFSQVNTLAEEYARYLQYIAVNWDTLVEQFGGGEEGKAIVQGLIDDSNTYYLEKLQDLIDAAVEAWKDFRDTIREEIGSIESDITRQQAIAGVLPTGQYGLPSLYNIVPEAEISVTFGEALTEGMAEYIFLSEEAARIQGVLNEKRTEYNELMSDPTADPAEQLAAAQDYYEYLVQARDAEMEAVRAYYDEQESLIQEKYQKENEAISELIDLLDRKEEFVKNIDNLLAEVRGGGTSAGEFNQARRDIVKYQKALIGASPEEQMDIYEDLYDAYNRLWSSGSQIYQEDWVAYNRLQMEVIDGLEGIKEQGIDVFDSEIEALRAQYDLQGDQYELQKKQQENEQAMEDELKALRKEEALALLAIQEKYATEMGGLEQHITNKIPELAGQIKTAFFETLGTFETWLTNPENKINVEAIDAIEESINLFDEKLSNWLDDQGYTGGFVQGLYYKDIPIEKGDQWWKDVGADKVDVMSDIKEVLGALEEEFTSIGWIGDELTGEPDANNAAWMLDRLTGAMSGGLTTQDDLDQLKAIYKFLQTSMEAFPSSTMYTDTYQTVLKEIQRLTDELGNTTPPPPPPPPEGYRGVYTDILDAQTQPFWEPAAQTLVDTIYDTGKVMYAIAQEMQSRGTYNPTEIQAMFSLADVLKKVPSGPLSETNKGYVNTALSLFQQYESKFRDLIPGATMEEHYWKTLSNKLYGTDFQILASSIQNNTTESQLLEASIQDLDVSVQDNTKAVAYLTSASDYYQKGFAYTDITDKDDSWWRIAGKDVVDDWLDLAEVFNGLLNEAVFSGTSEEMASAQHIYDSLFEAIKDSVLDTSDIPYLESVKEAIALMGDSFKNLIPGIGIETDTINLLNSLIDSLKTVTSATSYHTGGIVPETGLYQLHAGEVYNPSISGKYGLEGLSDRITSNMPIPEVYPAPSSDSQVDIQYLGDRIDKSISKLQTKEKEQIFVFVPYNTSKAEQERIYQDVKARIKQDSRTQGFIYDKALIKTNKGI